MLVKPLNELLDESKYPETLWFLGTVEYNEDPEKLGRIKVNITLYEGCTTEELPWACPILGSCGNSSLAGGLNVPEVGSQVRVFFPTKDLSAPFYMGAELNDKNKTTFFDDSYPETYGYKDSTGNFIKVNKSRETVQLQHSSTTNLKVSPDGSIQLSLNNGSYFIFDTAGAFEICIPSTKTLFAWEYKGKLIYTKTTRIDNFTKLFTGDGSDYNGSDFNIKLTSYGYELLYKDKQVSRSVDNDKMEDIVSISGTPDGSVNVKACSEITLKSNKINLDASMVETSGNLSSNKGFTGSFSCLGTVVHVVGGVIVGVRQ